MKHIDRKEQLEKVKEIAKKTNDATLLKSVTDRLKDKPVIKDE